MITVDASSPTPPYEQVRVQLAKQISNGDLVVGTRLPTVRRLAADLGLAVNTVARAYRELESAGMVQTRGRAGTIVTAAGNQARERLHAAAQTFAVVAHDTGLDIEQALLAVRAALTSTVHQ